MSVVITIAVSTYTNHNYDQYNTVNSVSSGRVMISSYDSIMKLV